MLKKRVIPTLLFNQKGNCVKPKTFYRPGRTVGSMMQSICVMESRNIDEIVLIDIDASILNLPINFSRISEYCKELFCPCTVGGGIKTLQDIEKLLRSGADKIIIGAMCADSSFINEAAKRFGSQCIVAAIDYKEVPYKKNFILPMPHINNARDCLSSMYLIDYIKFCKENGVGEILLTSVNRDSTRTGYNHTILKKVSDSVDIPIICNGGCSGFEDMHRAFINGAHAVAASSLFLFTPIVPNDCSNYLNLHGIETRVASPCTI